VRESRKGSTRRRFLRQAAALAGAMPLVSSSLTDAQRDAAASVATPPRHSDFTYASLSPDEGLFTEAMVTALCPADHLTPDGVTCGLVAVIDRMLAGDFGKGCARAAWDGYGGSFAQLPLTQEQFFKAGIAAVDAACRKRFQSRFDQLPAADALGFLRHITAGNDSDSDLPLASWFNGVVDPLLVRACFAGPIYNGYDNRVFWKLFGHAAEPGRRI
jgi:gluconate 2-dehydrogenase gamma chain